MANSKILRASFLTVYALFAVQCQMSLDLEVRVLDGNQVYFYAEEEDRRDYCILSAEIVRFPSPSQVRAGSVIWSIDKDDRYEEARCNIPVVFPEVPHGYVERVSAKELTPGYYRIYVKSDIANAMGEFEIK